MNRNEYMREYRKNLPVKVRYCECGRELDPHKKLCSECCEINVQHRNAIAQHNYRNSKAFYIERHSDKYRTYMREYMRANRGKLKRSSEMAGRAE